MIASISGNIINKGLDYLVIEAGGIGYCVFVVNDIIVNHKLNDKIQVVTYMVVREDRQALYGFLTAEELELFSQLISVSGVGPKVAMAILNSGKTAELKSAISHEDSAIFTAISGVGQKTAQRLILELKNKIGIVDMVTGSNDSEEVIKALSGLGYNMYEIRNIIGQVSSQLTLEEKIKEALKLLG